MLTANEPVIDRPPHIYESTAIPFSTYMSQHPGHSRALIDSVRYASFMFDERGSVRWKDGDYVPTTLIS